jgi:hypothetical protein
MKSPHLAARFIALLVPMLTLACEEPRRVIPKKPSAPIVPPPLPLVLRAVELDPTPSPDATPRSWVACVEGHLENFGQKIPICQSRERTWMDPSQDALTIVVEADHALTVRSHERQARFIAGRARLVIPLRPRMGKLAARAIADVTRLEIPLELETELGPAHGSLTLETPRVRALLREPGTNLETFGLPTPPTPSTPPTSWHILALGPDETLLPTAPDVPLSEVDVLVLDEGLPYPLPPCPESLAPRTARPIYLRALDFRDGAPLGALALPARPVPCGDEAPAPDLAASIQDLLTQPRHDPPPTLPLPFDPRDYPAGPGPAAAWLNALSNGVLGLDDTSDRTALASTFGTPIGPTVLHEGLEVHRFKGGTLALVAPKDGRLQELAFARAGLLALSSKIEHLESHANLLTLLEGSLPNAASKLGRPTDIGPGFARWTLDKGPLVFYLELVADQGRCIRVDLGWRRRPDPHDGGDIHPHHAGDPGHDSHRTPAPH